MSNPFLVDLDDNYTPYTSGTSTPFSGATTPKRRNSTNPFEVLSPESDGPLFLDNDLIQSSKEINNNNNTGGGGNVASTIADMTADFFQTISMKSYDFDSKLSNDNDVFEDNDCCSSNSQPPTDSNIVDSRPKTVSTVVIDNNGGPVFDPFETIHDDDAAMSSKRSSIESHQSPKHISLNHESTNTTTNQEPTSNVSKSSKAKDLFNSSMASIEMLSSRNVDESDPGDHSPGSNCDNDASFLAAPPQSMDIYSSDLSDLSDVSPTTGNDIRSAFNMYSAIDKEEVPKFDAINEADIIKRKEIGSIGQDDDEDDNNKQEEDEEENQTKQQQQPNQENSYFDPYSAVLTDSLEDDRNDQPLPPPPPPMTTDTDDVDLVDSPNMEYTIDNNNKVKIPFRLHEEETFTSGSIDINDAGHPNLDAEGIANDAFDELDKIGLDQSMVQPEEEEPTDNQPPDDIEPTTITTIVDDEDNVIISSDDIIERKASIEICEVESNNIQPSDLRELVEPVISNVDDDSNNNLKQEDVGLEEKEDEQPEQRNPVQIEEIEDVTDPFDTSNFDSDAFDAFESRFESTAQLQAAEAVADPFASPFKTSTKTSDKSAANGFDSAFEPFTPKQPENTPFKARPRKKKDSFEDSGSDFDDDDDEGEENIRIVIRAKMKDTNSSEITALAPPPLLPPPPKSPRHLPQQEEDEEEEETLNEEDMILMSYKTPKGKTKSSAKSFIDDEFDRFFDNTENRTGEGGEALADGEHEWPTAFGDAASKRTTGDGASPTSPQTPLYDEDTTQPLEVFPPPYLGDGWEMMLRHPAKKKLTANRYWKKIFVRFIPDTCLLQLFNKKEDNQPFQELPLQASYSLSEISAQQYDQYGKIFTIKVQYIFYRERVGVRPGQIAKVMQGQIQSMGDFARLGMPVEHAPQVSELLKIGSQEYADLKEFVQLVEESMFRMTVHRDRALTYRSEEIQCIVQDELFVEQNKLGIVEKQLARVRVFFLAFLNGMPNIEVGINDLRRQGKEVVGRHDILPVVTEEWIRVEAQEFHSCVQSESFDIDQVVRLIPPDACHFELMRFRIRPPRNRELPLQVSANMNITPTKMELKCDILVPGCISRKHGQIPCEEIQIRFHIPECWIYFFRVEKHFRYGAIHSTNRRSGKLKGLDRLLGTATNPDPQLIEVTAGQAKYEHSYHSIVWRIPRLPKDGQGAYTQQFLVVRLPLSSFDRIPESFYDYVHVEFTMPSTTVSHTTLRSISVNCENPPEKFVRYISKYEYQIGLLVTYDDTKPEPEYVTTVTNNGGVKNADQHNSSDEEGTGVETMGAMGTPATVNMEDDCEDVK